MIVIKELSKSFGGLEAVNKVSGTIKEGKITAIIGPNGSGKSTLFNLITGVLDADEGVVELDGADISKDGVYKRSRRGLSRTFQDVRIFTNLSIEDHLRLAFADDKEGLWSSLTQKEKNYDLQIDEILSLVGLLRDKKAWGSELSYGQQKLLSLAMAIANDHKVLMLDEPVAGVNPALREDIKKILIALRKKGETIVLIEHDMNFVMDLADDIIVLDEGKVLIQGPPKKIHSDPRVLEAYLGD